ncbi:hypothetical protein AB0A95_04925 [Micromonospora sp. NPDC049230]|uniref:hypothetical protein n=1 Tax=Micromonospora sp. NPDC049230 TaxID=3155502 RepID=UPI003404C886
MTAEIIAIGPLIYIAKLSGPDLGLIAQATITTIGGIALAVVGAITAVRRKRPIWSRR